MKKILSIFYTLIFIISAQSAHAIIEDKSVEMAMDSVSQALSEKGVEGKLRVSINGVDKGFRLRSEPDAYEVFVSDLSINEKTKFWKAILSFTTIDKKSEKFSVSGVFDKMINVPVLTSGMSRDAVIKEEDVTMLEVPASQVKSDTIDEAEKLIGQSLKRTIAAGIPLKEKDLQKAQIVTRNATINIVYNTPTISLKTVGIAMESGGAGDIVKIKNSSSGKIIQAIIKDDQNAEAIGQASDNQKTASNEGKKYVR